MQCAGMLEIEQFRLVCMPFFLLSSTVDDSGSNVACDLSGNKYTRMPLEHARPSTMSTIRFFAYRVYCLVQMTNGRAHSRWICTFSGHNGTDRTMDESKRWTLLNRMTPERGQRIVDRLFVSVLMISSGWTVTLLYAKVMLCILLIYPVHSGRGRIICKHNKNFF